METTNTALEEKIDLIQVLKKLWAYKKLYAISASISICFGFIIAFSIPKTYETEVILAPEIGVGGSLSGNLSDLASMVGVNIGSNNAGSVDAIYPEIYPKIINSTPFIIGLFDVKVSTLDKTVNNIRLYDYLTYHKKLAWWDKIFEKQKTANSLQKINITPFHLTTEQNSIIQQIRKMLKCNVDKKNSLITISVTAQDALVSASLADSVQNRLQEYVTIYRTKKARNDLKYAEKLVRDAKAEYIKSQQKYASYTDANADAILESFHAKQDEMENNMQLRYNIYNQLVQQVQAARAKVQERTPAFTQIQPATVPLKKAGPKRMSILLGFIVLSMVLTTFYVLIKK